MMFKKKLYAGLFLLLTACGATSEVTLMEALPTVNASVKPAVSTNPKDQTIQPANSSSLVDSVRPISSSMPSASAMPSSIAEASPASIKQGQFKNSFHTVTGKAFLLESAGKNYARLEDFSTDNGPDLFVYLVKNAEGNAKMASEFVNLGRLKATNGNQNYEIPAGTDLSQIKSISIWCQAFSVNFGFAPLM